MNQADLNSSPAALKSHIDNLESVIQMKDGEIEALKKQVRSLIQLDKEFACYEEPDRGTFLITLIIIAIFSACMGGFMVFFFMPRI